MGYNGKNPILPPSWQLYLADVEPHCFDGRMYLYGSCDRYGGGNHPFPNWCSDHYRVIFSDDLTHWTDAGTSFDLAWLPESLRQGAQWLWAPDVFRSPTDGKYYLLSCMAGGQCPCILISVSDSPCGPFQDSRRVTLDGAPITEIDPAAFVDDDGKVYLTWPFQIAQLDPQDYSRVLPDTVRQISLPEDNTPVEGPSIRKKNGIYYYIYVQMKGQRNCEVFRPTRMAYLTAEHPLGPYTYQGILARNCSWPSADNIHGSFEKWRDWWILAYHRHLPGVKFTRSCYLDRITFDKNGRIQEVVPTSSGIHGCFKKGEQIPAGSAAAFSGGRNDVRMVFSPARGVPYVYFYNSGQSVGFRYLDYTDVKAIKIMARGGMLALRDSRNGMAFAKISVPDTAGQWRRIKVPIQFLTGIGELWIEAVALVGKIDLLWLETI